MINSDFVETIGSSVVQHGQFNNRAYLMKLDVNDVPGIIHELDALVKRQGYTKVFAKAPASQLPSFLDAGYRLEALVPGFFGGQEDGVFLGKYASFERSIDPSADMIARNLEIAREKALACPALELPEGITIHHATEDDADEMAGLYRAVFASYPFPIYDSSYLRETMQSHIRYFCARFEGKIVALSSAEMDITASATEMTDFATLPQFSGKSLALLLLAHMERDPVVKELHTAYTIARSLSPSMNVTFARLGYALAGTLTLNTNISGNIESMNVWHKSLGKQVSPS
ncbi:MAG: putative beta-lysine N-acetyltransferase [Georgfuchsia sp.]